MDVEKKAEKFNAVKGMNDILPPDSARWEWFEQVVRSVMQSYGYASIRTPIVEPTGLFIRGLGQVTDIVEKEMYSFEDRLNGDALTLRPEGTAGVVRAAVEHALLYDGGKRLYYMGPMFRHERPQRGRYRQFHQVGVEALGFVGPDVDAEVILMCRSLWQKLGLQGLQLQINTLGDLAERSAHRSALIAYFEQHREQLDEDAQRRLHSNPLRILDTKNPAMQPLVEAAPRLMDYLGAASREHFSALCAMLDAAQLSYKINPRLVRGMDYYCRTVFEWVSDQLGAQGTVCGGGRYDGLSEQLGGKPAPGIGWGLGIERVLDLLVQQGLGFAVTGPDAYAVVPDAEAMPEAMHVLNTLRQAGVSVQMHATSLQGGASMKAQLKKADSSGARYALIFGADELLGGEVAIKSLRDGVGTQTRRPLAQVLDWAASLKTNL